jgi:hypothetical protein
MSGTSVVPVFTVTAAKSHRESLDLESVTVDADAFMAPGIQRMKDFRLAVV